jgi:hypothetical protein
MAAGLHGRLKHAQRTRICIDFNHSSLRQIHVLIG